VDRPPVFFTHQKLAVKIKEHPLAKNLPSATERPSIQAGPQNFRSFAMREDAPTTLSELVSNDRPQLSLHVTLFSDATLVGLSWPHTLMDAMGQQALLHAWSLVLAGRHSEVPPLCGTREDALCAAVEASTKQEEYKLEQNRLRGWALLEFGFRYVWHLIWYRKAETHTIYLPRTTITDLNRQAQSDLLTEENGIGKAFISEGDVLTAWIARVIACSSPRPTPMTLFQVANARFRLPSLLQAQGVFVQNMAIPVCTFYSRKISTQSLGDVALQNRRQLAEHTSEAQVLASLRTLQREYQQGTRLPSLFGEANALMLPLTNWTRANLMNCADFSGAIANAKDMMQLEDPSLGKITYHHCELLQNPPMARNLIVVLGKDHSGGYWVTGMFLRPSMWVSIKESFIPYTSSK
jgi:hypothetical protein